MRCSSSLLRSRILIFGSSTQRLVILTTSKTCLSSWQGRENWSSSRTHRECECYEWGGRIEQSATRSPNTGVVYVVSGPLESLLIQLQSGCWEAKGKLVKGQVCVCARVCVCVCARMCVRWFVPHCLWFFCDPVDCSLPGSSVHRISQARILEWVAISASSGSSQPRDWTHISCAGRRVLHHWAICSGIKGQHLEGTEQEDSYKAQSLSLAFSMDVLKKVMNDISRRVSYTLPTPSANENAISLSFPCRKGYQKWFERGAPA